MVHRWGCIRADGKCSGQNSQNTSDRCSNFQEYFDYNLNILRLTLLYRKASPDFVLRRVRRLELLFHLACEGVLQKIFYEFQKILVKNQVLFLYTLLIHFE